jgi:hypothetical protein
MDDSPGHAGLQLGLEAAAARLFVVRPSGALLPVGDARPR